MGNEMVSVKKLGEQLLEKKLITEKQLQEALQTQVSHGQFIGQIFVDRGWINGEQLTRALAEQYKMRFIKLKETVIEKSVIEKFLIALSFTKHASLSVVKDSLNVLPAASSIP